MGVDYHVAVHAPDWPTVATLQSCIDARQWPLVIEATEKSKRLEVGSTGGLSVRWEGNPIELEASVVTLSPTVSYAYTFERAPDQATALGRVYNLHPDETLKPVDVNETLASIGASGVRFEHGDRVLTLTFRIDETQWKVGFYLMAALINCSLGYGFELQQGAHGGEDYAKRLEQEAAEFAK